MASTLSSTRVVFQFPHKGSWLENIAVRSDGALLVTRVDVPEVWVIDPAAGTGEMLLTVPSPATSITGITELSPDVFALGVGQYDMAAGAIQGSFEVWVFNLASGPDSAQSTLRKVCAVPDAGLLNGLTTWDNDTVLAVDSTHGPVYKISVASGTFEITLNDEVQTPGPNAFIPIGINGIKVRDGYVYFTNSARTSFYRVPVDSSVKPTGPVEVVVSGFPTDDFVFDTDGTAYITTHPTNTIVKVAPGASESITVAGKSDSLEVGGATACAFGRREDDQRILYVVTSGALAAPVNGEVEPAKVVAIDLA
ncbi:hypothetical protein GQ53DRAFT_636260 [Thozetella sp. PMI_491]|nr:hypothetical protein GQ53DRAFT_636260 [Thozetella sp. PMI_491]